MIMGLGTATTDAEIISEYREFVTNYRPIQGESTLAGLLAVPTTLCKRIEKPILAWTDEDIRAVFANRSEGTAYFYRSFFTFLLFRGYRRASFPLIETLRTTLSERWKVFVAPYRLKVEQAEKELGYADPNKAGGHVGALVSVLLLLLVYISQALEDITRADFEAFAEAYQSWYLRVRTRTGHIDHRVARIERFLVHWKIIPPKQGVYRHEVLQTWKKEGWEQITDYLFTRHGFPWQGSSAVSRRAHELGNKLGVQGLSAHRFRHSFAVALLNYGIRESALQKLMGHAQLGMTLEYARILDQTVEQSFSNAIEHMQEGPHSWVPNFFMQEDCTLFAQGDTVSWIRLPLGYCRRNVKLHCESDVKCLLCDRFAIEKEDLPRLQQMYERFLKLGLKMKADVVAAQIQRLELPSSETTGGFIPVQAISSAKKRAEGDTMQWIEFSAGKPERGKR